MVQIVRKSRNANAEAIGQGITAFTQNFLNAKRYAAERAEAERRVAIEDAERARRHTREDEDRTFLQGERERLGEERAREDETRTAEQGFNAAQAGQMVAGQIPGAGQAGARAAAPMAGAGPGGAAVAMGGTSAFMARKAAEKQHLERLISKMSPAAGRMAVEDFKQQAALEAQQEQGRILSQAMVQMRTAVRDLTSQGVLDEEAGSALYAGLDPQMLAKADPQTMAAVLKEVEKAEKAMDAAIEQHAEDQARMITRQGAEAEINEQLAGAAELKRKGFLTADQFAEMTRSGIRLLANTSRYTPAQVEEALEDFKKLGKPPEKDADPRASLRAKLIERWVTSGIEEPDPRGDLYPPIRRAVPYDEAERMALQRVPVQGGPDPMEQIVAHERATNLGERPPGGVPRGTQAGANGGASSLQAPQAGAGQRVAPGTSTSATAAPGRGQAVDPSVPGKARDFAAARMLPRDAFLKQKGVGKKLTPDMLHRAVASAVAAGGSLEEFAGRIGLDLNTLTAEDLAAIEKLIREPLSGG